jgi:hypothetical protein
VTSTAPFPSMPCFPRLAGRDKLSCYASCVRTRSTTSGCVCLRVGVAYRLPAFDALLVPWCAPPPHSGGGGGGAAGGGGGAAAPPSPPQVGYCQGMGFITAMFLSYLTEEDAFFLLLSIMNFPPHSLTGLYSPGLPKVRLLEFQLQVSAGDHRRGSRAAWHTCLCPVSRVCSTQFLIVFPACLSLSLALVRCRNAQGLMKRRLPRLFAHFEALDIHPTMYSAQWFITIFTYNFPFSVVVRIWDCFLLEGWKVVFRVALGLLKEHEGTGIACVCMHGMHASVCISVGRQHVCTPGFIACWCPH